VNRLRKGPGRLTCRLDRQCFELVINAGSAKAMGLIIPPSVLKRADAVIP
jgi:hypothetical protein